MYPAKTLVTPNKHGMFVGITRLCDTTVGGVGGMRTPNVAIALLRLGVQLSHLGF